MLDIKQQHKISQQQQLSAHQYQALDLLELPLQDLQSRIEVEMNSNPLLEYESYPGNSLETPLFDEAFANDGSDDEYGEYYTDDAWHDDLPLPGGNEDFSAEQQQKRDYFFSTLTEKESIYDKLMQEIGALKLSENEKNLAESIIVAIDDNGFLRTNIADIAQSENADIGEVESLLLKLQKVFPPGVGARDLAECLKLQLQAAGEKEPALYALVDHIEDFGNNRIAYLAEKLHLPINEINRLGEKIRKLNPFPGSEFVKSAAGTVNPEVSVEWHDDELVLKQNDEILPKLKISEHYQQMLNDKNLPADAADYLKNKLNSAMEFKTALERREKTIIRIARFILENQYDFFVEGVEALHPMTMAQAAQALGNDEATISRGCRGKYIATPHGVFEFKYFFSGGYRNADGDEISSRAIQEKIREYIEDEDPYKPVSDEKISQKLREDGFEVARRTVAKYRDLLNILPTNLRRKHK